MLAWCPVKVDRNRDTSKPILFNKERCLLCPFVLENRAEPRKVKAGYVYSTGCNEVMPARQSIVAMPEKGYHEDDYASEVRHLEKLVIESPKFVSEIVPSGAWALITLW
jgi:hypothetical protein